MNARLLITLIAIATPLLAQVSFERPMITEVSWGDPDGLEITNFAPASVDMSGWMVVWNDGTPVTSSPLGIVVAPREIIVVKEAAGVIPEAPASTQILDVLPPIGTTLQAFSVALIDDLGAVVDEVRVGANPLGIAPPALGGNFRGWARRDILTGAGGQVGIERAWGFDSNGGTDWYEQPNRSFGLENRQSGPRAGVDTAFFQSLLLNEIDAQNRYIELVNPMPAAVNLTGWFLERSTRQGFALTRVALPGAIVPPGGFVVIGTSAFPPAELPVGVFYAQVPGLQFGVHEFAIGLYDVFGRCVDQVRATAFGTRVAHNHPRLRAPWEGMTGIVDRPAGATDVVGRNGLSADTDSGSDWLPVFTRSMGSTNSVFAGPAADATLFDARLNEGLNNGLTLILNAGPAAAGATWSVAYSFGHADGQGPFFGMAADALNNWVVALSLPGLLSGALDAQGSARVDLPSPALGPNFDTDNIFIMHQPGEIRLTPIIEFDT